MTDRVYYPIEAVEKSPFILFGENYLQKVGQLFEPILQSNGDIYLRLIKTEKRGDLTGSNSQTTEESDLLTNNDYQVSQQ